MMDFASSWIPESLDIVLIYPAEILDFGSFVRLDGNHLLLGEATLTRSAQHAVWDTAEVLAATSGLGDEDCVYLTLVLVNLDHPEWVEAVLGLLDSIRTDTVDRSSRPPYRSSELRQITQSTATRILSAWNEGETLGHPQRVEQLFTGRSP